MFCAVTTGVRLCDSRHGQAPPHVTGPAAALQVQGADVSPIDQAVHLGWEWCRALSVAAQSLLLLLKPTRLLTANLFRLLPPWAASQEIHPLVGASSLSQPEQCTSEFPKAPGATETTYSLLFKASGEGGPGDQINQWHHLRSCCFDVNPTLFPAAGWRMGAEPTLPLLAGPARPCAWCPVQPPSRRVRAFRPALT